MDNESSLLAHLVGRFKTQQEDAATDALAFILNTSEACRGALRDLLSGDGFDLGVLSSFETQVTYEDGSRPDMAGYDRKGSVRLVVESKFWAALLQGQASGYVLQLEEGPGVLMFIAPGARIETLWGEIQRQMASGERPVRLEPVEIRDRMRRAPAGPDKQVMLVSWDLVLDHLAASVPSDAQTASDIRQLRGLVAKQDDDPFLPLQQAEFNPSLPRRIRWYNHLVDEAVEQRGVPEGWLCIKKLNRTPQRAGHGRYFRFVDEPSGASFFLCVEVDYWAECGDTPVWLWVQITDDRLHLESKLHDGNGWFRDGGYLYTPIRLKTGVEYHHVLDDVVDQLRRIAEIVVA